MKRKKKPAPAAKKKAKSVKKVQSSKPKHAKKAKSTKATPSKRIAPPPPAPPFGGKRQFAEPAYVPLAKGTTNTGNVNEYDAYVNSGVLQPIPPPRQGSNMVVKLSDVIGQDAVDSITKSGQLVFHSVGDTGADKEYRVKDEDDVAAMMAHDLMNAAENERPAFFFHLGDVVYEFGQASSYYAHFYEPYCTYNAPIFAIPGNHDGMIWDPSMTTLQAFLDNFCAAVPAPSPNAGGLIRSTMNQPGVYFTLEAPFASIIGLYSNVSDKGAGVISSENGRYPNITDDQKNFLISELKRLRPARNANQTAVILAVHHPVFDGSKTPQALCKDLDDAFEKAGLYPDVVLTGHAHIYERFERTVNGKTIPYIIAGCGGYNLLSAAKNSSPNQKVPAALQHVQGLKAYIKAFGYLKVKATKNKLAVIFNCLDKTYGDAADSIVIDLQTHQITEGTKNKEPL